MQQYHHHHHHHHAQEVQRILCCGTGDRVPLVRMIDRACSATSKKITPGFMHLWKHAFGHTVRQPIEQSTHQKLNSCVSSEWADLSGKPHIIGLQDTQKHTEAQRTLEPRLGWVA